MLVRRIQPFNESIVDASSSVPRNETNFMLKDCLKTMFGSPTRVHHPVGMPAGFVDASSIITPPALSSSTVSTSQ
jgi:hypothetical protein